MAFQDTNELPTSFEGWKIAHYYELNKPLYHLQVEIGQGAFGTVYRAVDLRTNGSIRKAPIFRAIKVMKNFGITLHEREALGAEERLHAKVQHHDNIMSVLDVVEFGNYKFFVYEMMDIDLFDLIAEGKLFYRNDDVVKKVISGIMNGVQACHDAGVYHRDLKPENIMCKVDGDGQITSVVLGDFGLATQDPRAFAYSVGSLHFISPEGINPDPDSHVPHHTYSTRLNDLWAVGIIMINITTGRLPWRSANPSDRTYMKYEENPAHFLAKYFPISSEFIDILLNMLTTEKKRTSLRHAKFSVDSLPTFFLTDDQIAHGTPPDAVSVHWRLFAGVNHRVEAACKRQKHRIPRVLLPFKSPMPKLPQSPNDYRSPVLYPEHKVFGPLNGGKLIRQTSLEQVRLENEQFIRDWNFGKLDLSPVPVFAGRSVLADVPRSVKTRIRTKFPVARQALADNGADQDLTTSSSTPQQAMLAPRSGPEDEDVDQHRPSTIRLVAPRPAFAENRLSVADVVDGIGNGLGITTTLSSSKRLSEQISISSLLSTSSSGSSGSSDGSLPITPSTPAMVDEAMINVPEWSLHDDPPSDNLVPGKRKSSIVASFINFGYGGHAQPRGDDNSSLTANNEDKKRLISRARAWLRHK